MDATASEAGNTRARLSVLDTPGSSAPVQDISEPCCFRDLNLDQIVTAVVSGKEEYGLVPFFQSPLRDVDTVNFRHEVIRDLENDDLLAKVTTFAKGMRAVRADLAQIGNHYYQHQDERWFLDGVKAYVDAVERLSTDFSAATFSSRGITAFAEFLNTYKESSEFLSLARQAREIETDLTSLRYVIQIEGGRVDVRRYEGESDYSVEVAEVFERFSQGDTARYRFNDDASPGMSQVEGRILDLVADLHQETFAKLGVFTASNANFQSPDIVSFDREIQFFVAYLDYIQPLKALGVKFCLPEVSETGKQIHCIAGTDLALAAKLAASNVIPVPNDLYLDGPERILVVSGPNQGGKTTFARMFGQLHYLASLGLPVPAREARLYLCDAIFTHFEREERMTNLRGKLQDDLVRIHDILESATEQSVIVINEIFASTTLNDAILLSRRIAGAIMELDALCVWVTFVDEVASLSQKSVSMVSSVDEDNPTARTFKVIRRPADGLAYAMSVVEKHRLTYDAIKERLQV